MLGGSSGPAIDGDRLIESFAWARRGALLAPTSVVVGYRVFWTRPPAMGFLDLPATPGAYAILGRHDRCDGILLDDPGVSLRHLLLTSYALDGGGVALRMLDLLTGLPMYLDDGIPRRSLVTTGAARIRVGSYVIGALPILGGKVDVNAALAEASSQVEVHETPVPPRITLSSPRVTGVASLPAVWSSNERPGARPFSSRIVSYRDPAYGRVPAGMAQLTLRRSGREVTVEVHDEDLERGLLLGRADRCLDSGLRSVLTAAISRTHLLLLRDRDRTFAFDVASMNGTYQSGKLVRRAQLNDEGSRLWLGPTNPNDGLSLSYHRGPTLH